MALGKILVNNQVGNPRRGRRYVEVKDGDEVIHRYGVQAGRDDVKWNSKSTDLATNAMNRTSSSADVFDKDDPRSVTPKPAVAAKPKAGLAKQLEKNAIKGSVRFGKAYKTETRNGREVHVYADGQVIAAKKKRAS